MSTLELKQNRPLHIRRQVMRDRINKWLSLLTANIILGIWSLFTLFVILWIAISSLKSNRELFLNVWALPTKLEFENYVRAWNNLHLGSYFLNSFLVVISAVIIILVLSAPASYTLSRVKFRGRNLLTMIFVAGIGVPLPLLFIPLFVILSGLKLINTLPGLGVLYVASSIPFTVYMLTSFFSTLPVELEEAAILDGCSDIEVFTKVMLPLASPGLITAAIFNFIFLWNEYQLALVFQSNPKGRTLSLGLYALQNSMEYTGDWVGLMAGVVCVIVPTILLYIFLSERMISGITMGAVKS
jgi:ABC-type glycerol-3-phosphate transport system permease component